MTMERHGGQWKDMKACPASRDFRRSSQFHEERERKSRIDSPDSSVNPLVFCQSQSSNFHRERVENGLDRNVLLYFDLWSPSVQQR
mmetsp:Transcript_13400/g.24240  ORF Transcript_13400/g.24240 Transcript_13400/m.24240 type:complete len:86 (-) Transcript_13400:54-311(-)